MAALFRPWMQSDSLQQDDTVSTTTAVIKQEPVPVDSRHSQYNCVKEHVRERSEKKSRRSRHKLASNVASSESESLEQPVPPAVTLESAYSPVPSLAFPSFMDPYNAQILGLVSDIDSGKDCWEELSLSSPELVDAALAQGIPPIVLEEYVRVMTEQQRQIAEKNRKQRPKKFRCPHCQVGFSNNGQLKGHIRIHTGERPFKCEAEHCGKSFTRNEELTRHRRIHSGLRPFPCPDCGKRFGRKDHLKKHIRTHYQQRYHLVPILPSHYPFLLGM